MQPIDRPREQFREFRPFEKNMPDRGPPPFPSRALQSHWVNLHSWRALRRGCRLCVRDGLRRTRIARKNVTDNFLLVTISGHPSDTHHCVAWKEIKIGDGCQ
jgi:hypothetical protein